MSGSLHNPLLDWRDALQDLGLMGLVPPCAPAAPALAPTMASAVASAGAPQAFPDRVSSEAPSYRPSRALAPSQTALEPLPTARRAPEPSPNDPRAFPPADAVASASDLSALDACIRDCLACPLGTSRIRFVFGEGAPQARMMFIGEGPGRDEDLQGRPFVGKAGELLDKMIGAIGFQRSEVFIANVVKCRPPDNRTPTPQESQRCLPHLKRQIELIRPSVIVTLGATPLRELLGVSTGITRIRGQWQRLEMCGGIPVMPTFHPAYVLRQYTQDVRRAVWSDLQAARKWLDESGKPPQTSGE
ncbi:MAG TPA: uracil-DNA glycosylase [Holophaga sp.]|nr:uracil-DNA glycosylase [Holophaga sp.]